jgi:tRNA (guanine-N(7)-)-methyltransferase subunit TRM82
MIADSDKLSSLDLYSPLVVLPKNSQVEHDPMDREAVDLPHQKGSETPGKGKGKTKSLSAKELARLTRKQKLEEQLQARAAAHVPEPDDAERDPKKQRSDEDGAVELMDMS